MKAKLVVQFTIFYCTIHASTGFVPIKKVSSRIPSPTLQKGILLFASTDSGHRNFNQYNEKRTKKPIYSDIDINGQLKLQNKKSQNSGVQVAPNKKHKTRHSKEELNDIIRSKYVVV